MLQIECGDALEVMRTLPDNSVDLIATDPPYYRVKNLSWDRQWDKPAQFLAWMGELADEWRRLLKPNGSLYVFASPKMAARVEVMIGERFEVLNRIRWVKTAGWHNKNEKEALRSYLSPWEEIIFAEQFGFVFEPLRAYLDGERCRAGLSLTQINVAWQAERGTKGCMTPHWFGGLKVSSQWQLITEPHYIWLRRLFNIRGSDYLRREYEDLRREYEALRRPFEVSADVPYTDVWDFPTVQAYRGKHPCEKPLDLMRHIIRVSSRPGAVVLDCFAGSGVTGQAAKLEGRSAILIERDPHWIERIHERLKVEQPAQTKVAPKLQTPAQGSLFDLAS